MTASDSGDPNTPHPPRTITPREFARALLLALRASSGALIRQYADPLLKALAAASALAVLLGAVWAAAYFTLIAHTLPDVSGDSIPSALVLLAVAGSLFLLFLLFTLQYGGIWLGLHLKNQSYKRRILLSAFTFTPIAISLALVVSFNVGNNGWLLLAAFAIPMCIVAVPAMRPKGGKTDWGSLAPMLGVYACSWVLGLCFVYIIGSTVDPSAVDSKSNALALEFYIILLFCGLNILTASIDIKWSPVASVAALLLLLVVYGDVMVLAPFRLLHVGSYQAELKLDPRLLEDQIIKNCFVRDGPLVRGYVMNSLGSEVTLMSRNPSSKPSSRDSTALGPETLNTPCTVQIPKHLIEMVVIAATPLPTTRPH